MKIASRDEEKSFRASNSKVSRPQRIEKLFFFKKVKGGKNAVVAVVSVVVVVAPRHSA
jgi:hypothetical protein